MKSQDLDSNYGREENLSRKMEWNEGQCVVKDIRLCHGVLCCIVSCCCVVSVKHNSCTAGIWAAGQESSYTVVIDTERSQ